MPSRNKGWSSTARILLLSLMPPPPPLRICSPTPPPDPPKGGPLAPSIGGKNYGNLADNSILAPQASMDNRDCMMNNAGALPFRRGLLCVLACLVAVSCASAQRLPDNVRPEHYALRFTPDLKAATYTGEESIEVTVAQPTATVVLNATEIAFQSVSISAGGQDQTA